MFHAKYKHEPIDLAKDAIRLVRILRGEYNEPLRCEIFQSYLNPENGVPYEALSYTWGDPTIVRVPLDIIESTNGPDACLSILPNLYKILQQLRHNDRDRIVWVDAICIDQTGDHDALNELNHQVRQMRQVYAGAVRVIVWLGDFTVSHLGGPDHDGFFLLGEFANKLASLALGTTGFELDPYSHWEWHFDELMRLRGYHGFIEPSFPVSSANATHYLRISQALSYLLEAPWFKRVWIIQEVASAKSGTVLYSQHGRTACIPMRAFAMLPSLMFKTGFRTSSHTQAILDIMPVQGQRRRGWWNEGHDLEMLLMKFQDSLSTEPRDFVYALLGISEDTLCKQVIQPDYAISESQVFRDTVSYLLFSKLDPPGLPLPADKETVTYALNDRGGFQKVVFFWAVVRDHYETALHILNHRDIRFNPREGEALLVRLAEKFTKADPGGSRPEKIANIWEIAKILVQKHVSVNIYIQASLRRLATRYGGGEIFRLLEIRGDKDFASRGSQGDTTMDRALRSDSITPLKALLIYEDINLDTGMRERGPSDMALRTGQLNAVQLLLNQKDNVVRGTIEWEHAFGPGVSMFMQRIADLRLLQTSADFENFDRLQNTILGTAIADGNAEKVDMVLQDLKKYSHYQEGRRNPSLLSFAASHGETNIIDLLLQSDGFMVQLNPSGVFEALHWAIRKGDARVFERLWTFSRGPMDEVGNLVWGDELLSRAVAGQHFDIVKTMLVEDVDGNVDSRRTFLCGDHYNAPRMTPLKIASLIGDAGLVRCILESATEGIDLEASARECCGTPLWAAASQNHVDVVLVLLQHGANLEAKGFHLGQHKVNIDWDQAAYTPLSEAVYRGHVETVQLLLSSRANLGVFGAAWDSTYAPNSTADQGTRSVCIADLLHQAIHSRDGTREIADNFKQDLRVTT